MPEVEVDGLRIAYAQAGAGPPLVLLHGGLDDSRSWRRQLEGLAPICTVYAWDAPGCGRSSDPPATWRLPEYADCVAGWLAAAGVVRPHVLGLSWGSSIAIELYRRHPGVPASLVLASAYAGWAGSLPPEEVEARLAAVLAGGALTRQQLREEGRWAGVFGPSAPPEVVAELGAIAADNGGVDHPAAYEAMVRSMAEADLRDVLPTIRVPTLLLYGELDERSPLSLARALHAAIPGSSLHVIPGAGHMTCAEAPDRFDAAVAEWIGSRTS